MVLEFCDEKQDLPSVPLKEIADELNEEFCIEDSNCKGRDLSVYNKIQIVYTKLKALRGKIAQEFTNKEFKSPSNLEGYLNFVLKDTPPKQGLRKKLLATKKENIPLKWKLNDSFEQIIETELNELQEKYISTSEELEKAEEKIQENKTELTKQGFP